MGRGRNHIFVYFLLILFLFRKKSLAEDKPEKKAQSFFPEYPEVSANFEQVLLG